MEPVKKIAGKILLYFYSIQMSDYTKLHDLVLEFQMRHFSNKNDKSPKITHKGNVIVQDLINISGNDNNVYNALAYLRNRGLIEVSKSPDNVSDNFLNFSVSSAGIDIIEGIEERAEERDNFYITFNIKLADNVNIDSLIKAELGSLIKASLV